MRAISLVTRCIGEYFMLESPRTRNCHTLGPVRPLIGLCVRPSLQRLCATNVPIAVSCRFNEREARWVALDQWTYTVEFDAPLDVLHNEHVDLLLHGVDTFATITLNGEAVAQVENYHRCAVLAWLQGHVCLPG